jgi:pimeloyl-ACP methyl ester carboxylesterase
MIAPGLLLVISAVLVTLAPPTRWPLGSLTRASTARVVTHDSSVLVAPAERIAIRLVGPLPIGSAGVGDATVIVLVPGPVGSAFAMRHVSAALAARGLSVLIIDPLGMGRSAHPAHADYSLTAQARRIEAVLDTLQVSRALLVAQGTSATMAFRLAGASAERIVGVLSLAGGPIERQETPGVRLALALAPILDNPLGRAIGRRRFLAAVREQSAVPEWCTSEVAAHYLAPIEADLRGALRTLRAMQSAVEPTGIEAALRRVRVPVRLLVGDHRTTHAPSAAQLSMLQRHVTSFTVDTITGAGTMLHEERADAVVSAVFGMLERPGGARCTGRC